ncbi:MAG: valine--tRNA ligase [Candidatus Parvarchaeota archaeon]|nr:valine--tRNA ligase [Candidatus Parvarchaeota archaeon]
MAEDNAKSFLASFKAWNRELELKTKEGSGARKYAFDKSSKLDVFSMDTPPPYTSGKTWHLGAVAHYSQIDMIARSQRMLGKEVLFPVGMDRNGIPVERYAEKTYGVSMASAGREKFLFMCKTALDDLETSMIKILHDIGYSADFENIYRTDSDEYRAFTQATFIEHWKSKRIYKGKRPSNYCIDCGTTIADAEIEYVDLPSKLVYIKFSLKGGDKSLSIATTRPELLGACRAVMVNPTDERYKDLIGKSVTVPLYGYDIRVIEDESAKPEFGSGVVMICSYGDYNDVLLFKKFGLDEKILIDTSGKMNENAGESLSGLTVKEARKKIVEILKEKGLVEKEVNINHRTPLCDRSKTPIEIIPMDEYFLRTSDKKEVLLEMAKKIDFIPEQHRQILINWINVASDWPISRRRFYGTEIPIWYCKKCGEPYIPPPGKYYKPWKESPPGSAECASCKGKEFIGDERTLDTWMDSSVSALYVTGYGRDEDLSKKTYPVSVRPQGVDIIRTWMYYSMVRCSELTGMSPWKSVWVGGMGLDEHGEKMSKSKGNFVDPVPLINKYGADAFRFWSASEASVGSNFLYSESKVAGSQKFLTKLLNLSRLISSFGEQGYSDIKYDDLMPSDKWIIGELSLLVKDAVSGYSSFNFLVPSNRIRNFVWSVFAPHYVEMVKARAYGNGFSKSQRNAALYTLNYVLNVVLLLTAPICPFITDALWLESHGKEDSVHSHRFPEQMKYEEKYMLGDKIIEFNSMVWGKKKEGGLSLRDNISIDIPDDLKDFSDDLKAMHNIK